MDRGAGRDGRRNHGSFSRGYTLDQGNLLDQLEVDRRAEAAALTAKHQAERTDAKLLTGLREQLAASLDNALNTGELPWAIADAENEAVLRKKRFGHGVTSSAPNLHKTLPPLSPEALVIGTRRAQRSHQKNADKLMKTTSSSFGIPQPGSLGPLMKTTSSSFGIPGPKKSRSSPDIAFRAEPERTGRFPKAIHDPAKINERRSDGRVNMKGVRDTSDVSLYNRFNPYSKNAFDVRTAFKLRQFSNSAAPASKTWGAVNKWYTSGAALDDFMADEAHRRTTNSSAHRQPWLENIKEN